MKSPNEYKYVRLELLERMETLKEEINEMSEMLKDDLKKDTSDKRIEELTQKLQELEKQIVSIIS